MKFISDNELYKIIGSNIKFYRKNLGWTQAKLAEQAQISLSYLSKIEANGCKKSLSISALNQISNALNIDISLFFKEAHDVKNTK